MSGHSWFVCVAVKSGGWYCVNDHSMPESFSAFCSMVSLTAAKTSRMFDVSVACVRLKRSACVMVDGGEASY
jgi:hypothetical protein